MAYRGRFDLAPGRGSQADPPWTSIEVLKEARVFGRFRTRMIGRHNGLNALAAVAVADHIGISAAAAAEALESFEGVKRRQEIRGRKARHRRDRRLRPPPHGRARDRRRREVRLPRAPAHRRLRAAHQLQHAQGLSSRSTRSRSTGRTSSASAGRPCWRRSPRPSASPRRSWWRSFARQGKTAAFFPDTEGIIDFIVDTGRSGDVVLIMSNGGFDNIHERLLGSL